jgi:hypothetical protein
MNYIPACCSFFLEKKVLDIIFSNGQLFDIRKGGKACFDEISNVSNALP